MKFDRVVLVLCPLGLLFLWGCSLFYHSLAHGQGGPVCRLDNRAVKESSGLAYSLVNPGVLWTHNDSGDKPRLFAFGSDCRDLGVLSVKGASARDWEDISIVRLNGKSHIFIADTGDNNRRRKSCALYLVKEPTLRPGQKSYQAGIRRRLDFTYEDGPRNCEAAAVDPTSGIVLLIGKNLASRAPVYTVDFNQGGKGARAVRLTELPLTLVTALDISPDGTRALVATYGDGYEYRRRPGESWASAFFRPPLEVPLPRRNQGESVCYGPDGFSLFLTSERTPAPLWFIPRSPD